MNNMFKNPFRNGIFAEAYIMLVVLLVNILGKQNMPNNIFDPIAALSLFVLSAAIMGYLFLGEPLQLYLNDQKKEAVSFFAKTVTFFAILTLVVFVIVSFVR